MGEAKRRAAEIAAGKYKGRAKDLEKNQKPKIRYFRFKDPSISTREMNEAIRAKEKSPVDFVNPENERKK